MRSLLMTTSIITPMTAKRRYLIRASATIPTGPARRGVTTDGTVDDGNGGPDSSADRPAAPASGAEQCVTIDDDPKAGVAQLVEQLIRNQQVDGSSPFAGSNS